MKPILTILLSLCATFVFAQTNISGIINDYYKVVEVVTPKACVRVDNTSGLALNDLVLIIQMKGATVSTTNNSTFGSLTNLQEAGNYEIGTICSINGDSVFLFKELAQSYSVTEKVQLVRIPQYNSAIVTDTLKAAQWDSASGKGGVLALCVSDDLVLQAPLSANNSGYRGGAYVLSSSTCSNFFAPNNYAYNPSNTSPQDGAYKGESIATLTLAQSGGKGASANGGGGGNNHNNGGGGGANLAAGGLGGGNSSATGCTVANAGRGGYALSSNSGNKIFMGGGGGAGHANSGVASTGGGRGGGIIIMHANQLISNGHKIMANGEKGGNTLGDGASGGGGGGTIVFDVNNYTDPLNAEATGGNGGDENDDFISQRCYAEGGGGSGGVVYFKNALPAGTINVTGGIKGSRLNSVSCATIIAGTNGTNGMTVPDYNFIQSSILSTYCGAALDVQLLWFNAKADANAVSIDWQVDNVNDLVDFVLERKKDGPYWQEINTVNPIPNIQHYSYNDENLNTGLYYYRLKWTETNGSEKYSAIKLAEIGSKKLSLYPNPASRFITITYAFRKGSFLNIFNSAGALVLQKKIIKDEEYIIHDISSLPNGMYYANVDNQWMQFRVHHK